MILEKIARAILPDRGLVFLSREIVTGPDDPEVDAFECDGYNVHLVDLMTLQVRGTFFNLTIYDSEPKPHRKSYFGNEIIKAETHALFMKEEEPLDISEPT